MCVCVPTLSNMNHSEVGELQSNFNGRTICVWGKAALGFVPDRIRNQVDMATDSSHRVIMRKNM